MRDPLGVHPPTRPPAVAAIEEDTKAVGFTMASDAWTGSLLATLAVTRPGGAFLELGTGTGLSTAWLLSGMDAEASLLSVDNDESVVDVARRHLSDDRRVSFVIADGERYLEELLAAGRSFDLVFADAIPGKYTRLEEALGLMKPGGLYVVDDMLPQPNWPDDHHLKVAGLIEALASRPDFRVTHLRWSTGLVLAAKKR